ncbi:MAG: DUF6273 domain-containing protein [Lachnospiraceae bacterium]|nr:DUF6273 domain-containing protein [Lachnospiraceae bacterium]
MKKKFRKWLAFALAFVLMAGVFSSMGVEAKAITLPVPKIKVSLGKNGTDVKVTINKTKNAEGYVVWVKGDVSYENYKGVDWNRNVDDYVRYAVIKKDGTKKRSLVLKSLPAGKISVKVFSYNEKNFGTMTYSAFSEPKSVTVTKEGMGYKTSYDFSNVKKGSIIKFGTYEQDNNLSNGKEPIEWVVLDKTKKNIFVISRYALDKLPYNYEGVDIVWEDCTLRKWLNEEFYESAFNQEEKDLIKSATVENFDNAIFDIAGGEDTKDKVFLLSQLESINTDFGFDSDYDTYDETRVCEATKYARNSESTDTCRWWLRSPGNGAGSAAIVYESGFVFSVGYYVDTDIVFVRPAMVITLNP